MTYRSPLAVACMLLGGCQAMMYGTGADMNTLALGMPRAEVLQKLGQPNSTSANAMGETLHYRKMERALGWSPTDYFVRLEAGKVVEFGRRND